MNEKKGRELFKCALGLVLSILVIVGAVFGIDIKVDVNDTNTPSVEETVITDPPETESPQCPEDAEDAEDVVTEEQTSDTPDTPSETTQQAVDVESTPTETENASVETPIETTTSEGDEQNA